MGVRVVSGRAITKDKFVPEGGQDLEFWEIVVGSKSVPVGTGQLRNILQ
jgi:hypothetical protein